MRNYIRVGLVLLCSLAAFVSPIFFLEDRPKVGYLIGGLVAAVLARQLLVWMIDVEHHLPTWLRGALGAAAGALSWAPITLVAVFDVIPNMAEKGFNRFDPVWISGGVAAPLAILAIAVWHAYRLRLSLPDVVMTALYRYSFPLLGLDLLARIPSGLPKQYPWLFLFTGALFLTLDIFIHGVEPKPYRDSKV
ncbi:MAG: hypothetical protein K0R39_1202 [Symbiobacteriaceae bacterium]|jgi:hypothetical protein|nr:hypothetical protein [Symbiobacteriaceae bacterium]